MVCQKINLQQRKNWQFYCPADEVHAARLRCSNPMLINFDSLQQLSVWFQTHSNASCSLNWIQISIHDLIAANRELQSPAYELAEDLDEPRYHGTACEFVNSSLKIRSRWTSIRPHLSLRTYDADRGSEPANDPFNSTSDSYFHSNSLPSRSVFGKNSVDKDGLIVT